MTYALRTVHAHPLEREFEAWIVAGIERYFRRVGLRFSIWAISPSMETTWPGDQALWGAAKIVGLQFKQAKIQHGASDATFEQLHWTFDQPPKQHQLVLQTPEIYYCLPTFVNRTLRRQALDHCLFWRPPASQTGEIEKTRGWYDNPRATHKSYNGLKDQMRWGRFWEGILACHIGRKVSSPVEGTSFLSELNARMRVLELLQADEEFAGRALYLIAVQLPQ